MDILRVLSSPDLEVRRKTLSLAMELVTSRNIEEMVLILKKEINKTTGSNEEDTSKYRQLLVRTLHSACIKFPDVANTVIPLLMEFLSDTNELAAMDVLIFVREAMNRSVHIAAHLKFTIFSRKFIFLETHFLSISSVSFLLFLTRIVVIKD